MILVAIGTNLPAADGTPPIEVARRAAQGLDGLLGLRLRAVSRWYETAPVPPSDQPPYINGVARLDGTADPVELLGALHRLEAEAGRVRGAPNAARTLDLDLIDLDGQVRDEADPVLPHPRAYLRAFVLVPLADVAPDWVHPRLGCGVSDLLAGLPAPDNPAAIRPVDLATA
jgi:2-amino-4-hydroxy-6-hydroxymethyldihydropteridine diphosphokinase